MSSSTNSVPPFTGGNVRDAIEALGITQFPSATTWYQVIGGLIIQGGYVTIGDSALIPVPFVAPYEKQVLFVVIQPVGGTQNGAHVAALPALDQFSIQNGVGDRDFYWLSLGV